MDIDEFVAWKSQEKVRAQAQARANYAAERARERELGETWTRLLSGPVAGEPAPEPIGATEEGVQQMAKSGWAKVRSALLGIPDRGSDFARDTSSWSDRAQERIAAQHVATARPETELDKYAQERAALGVRDVGDVTGDPRGNLRGHKSPWQL